MKKKITTLTTLITVTAMTACGPLIGENTGPYGMFSPKPMLMRGLPQGDDAFSKGFRDGCYNFMGQNGYGLLRIYDIPPAPEYVNNKLYKLGYIRGDRHCGVYVNKGITL